jgi:hypothetical protein
MGLTIQQLDSVSAAKFDNTGDSNAALAARVSILVARGRHTAVSQVTSQTKIASLCKVSFFAVFYSALFYL